METSVKTKDARSIIPVEVVELYYV
ncbi:hypothetical protein A2U01_0094688, partial [Trifolium medium]|nr:hypothetical protein [Trifolium medium]